MALHISAQSTQRDAVAALLRVQSDLRRTLLQQPEAAGELETWRNAISMLLLESARGRLFLSRLQPSLAEECELVPLAG
ncbi:MAG TPA: hypothetical protein VMW62_00720 [Chloroflexota bacterium]|nr:hypothetical protein [Chloroflexota bacterium]